MVKEIRAPMLERAVAIRRPDRNFEVVDPTGKVVLAMVQPSRGWRSTTIVSGADDQAHGEIVHRFRLGKARFALEAGGAELGSIDANDWRAWNFKATDPSGTEIAKITKTWAGWTKERFTKADNYVVVIHRPLEEPLRSLLIAAALAIDTTLKQGEQTRGSSLWGTRSYQ